MLKKYLKQYFGYSEFRKGQEEIIQSVLDKKNMLVVMPTGGGKSLCFQLPALLMQGTALVISPLIALMKDQYDSLEKNDFPATYINSSLSFEESSDRISRAINGEYKLIYIAPERLGNEYFLKILSKLTISFLAVDEAHCISEWGHDFRPAYLNIAKALDNISISHVVALTATATPDVQQDIIQALNMKNPELVVTGFDRENLSYITENTVKKIDRVVDIINKTKEGATIIYCGSRKKTEDVFKKLKEQEISAAYYHAGMTIEERKFNQNRFINGQTNVVIATNAFGMGIDKPDVRNVIHLDFTGTIEAYYQEAGRAGRDGLPAKCYMLYNFGDKRLQEFFIDCTYPQKSEFKDVYDYIFENKKNIITKTDSEIGNVLGIPAFRINSTLNYFERLNIIERINNPVNAKIRFCYTKNDMLNFLNNTNEKNKIVLEALIRSFTEEAIKKFVDIDVKNISRKYDINQKTFDSAINNLTKAGVIEYQNEIPANSIVILENKQKFELLKIDFEQLEKRKKNATSKFEKVVEYAVTNKCKRNFILDYFKDTSYKGKCEKCSACVNKKQIVAKEIQVVLAAAAELNGKFGRYMLALFLKGTKNDKTKIYALNKGNYFGKLKNEAMNTIYTYIDNCIEVGFLEKTEGEYPLIFITDNGKSELKNEVKPLEIVYQKTSNSSFMTEKLFETKNNIIQKTKITLFKKEPAKKEKINPDLEIVLKIDSFFKNGLTIEEIAKKLNISNGKIAELIQNAVEKHTVTDYTNYTTKTTYYKVKQIIEKKPTILLRDVQSQMPIPINFALLRIIVAFVRAEISNMK